MTAQYDLRSSRPDCPSRRDRPFPASIRSLAVLALWALAAAPTGARGAELAELSLEQLLDVEVHGVSKFAQKLTEAPASVTIVTAADIRDYGYRTLADILRGVRGLNVSYDRNYSYLGVRGFGRTGDFNGRMLLLVDGHRMNDPVYDTAALGTEFALDVDLIDRVEIVRGPGSSIYGSNAVFGTVNVITRRGRDFDGAQVSGELASFGTDKERLTWGGRSDTGTEWLVSATRYRGDGRDLYFPEFGASAHDLDYDRYDNVFAKWSRGGFSLAGAWSRRDKGTPTASFNTVFDDPNARSHDGNAYVDLGYAGALGPRWEFAGHLAAGRSDWSGIYPYIYAPGDPVTLNRDITRASWRSAEARLVGRFDAHTLMAGFDYQDNRRQNQANFDLDPYASYLDDRRSSTRAGVYLQDEIALSSGLILNAGLRHDHDAGAGDALNPRLALIWSPRPATTLKWLYGTAFRAPNAYELYYAVDPQKANPNLSPEKSASYEFALEHYLRADYRLAASAYYNRIENLVDQVVDPNDGLLVFENRGSAVAKGLEFELERLWRDGTRLRASYAWQLAEDETGGARLVDSPRHLAKLNLAAPLFAPGWRGGLELQYVGARKTLAGAEAKAYVLANVTLLNERLSRDLSLSASVYNLFDRRYADPGGPELIHDSGVALDTLAADGRNFRLKATWQFR